MYTTHTLKRLSVNNAPIKKSEKLYLYSHILSKHTITNNLGASHFLRDSTTIDRRSLTLLTLISRDNSLHKSVHDHLIIISQAGGGGWSRVRVDVSVQSQGGTAGGSDSRTNTLDLVVSGLKKDTRL